MIARVQSFVRTVWFVITDTVRSRKGSVPSDPARRAFYRDASGPRACIGSTDTRKIAGYEEQGLSAND